MKKLMFTAIALVAFSGVSMAAETNKKNKKKIEVEIVIKKDCQKQASAMLEYMEEEFGCLTSYSYNQFYMIFLSECETSN